jgi:hypothetical protein
MTASSHYKAGALRSSVSPEICARDHHPSAKLFISSLAAAWTILIFLLTTTTPQLYTVFPSFALIQHPRQINDTK